MFNWFKRLFHLETPIFSISKSYGEPIGKVIKVVKTEGTYRITCTLNKNIDTRINKIITMETEV